MKLFACSFFFIIVKGIIRINVFLVQIYCSFLLVYYSKRDHRIKIFLTQINCLFLFFIIVKGIIRIKIFLVQIYCLFVLAYYSKKSHRIKIFLTQIYCLFLLFIIAKIKKSLMLHISIMLLFLYEYFLMLHIRLIGLNK